MTSKTQRQLPTLGQSLLLTTSIIVLSSTPALAQQAPAPNETNPEIIVTAQFRNQRLQDTPIAITAATAEMLETRSQRNIVDIAGQTPSLYIAPSGTANGPGATIAMRGIGQSDNTLALEPGVGMYIDDVYYSTVLGSNFDLLDLDRVEILRGPQGTLAGKNSIGGAIKLFSKKPNGDPNAFVDLTYGSYNRAELRAASNITIVPDHLFARISGAATHRDGFVKRIDYGCANPASGIPSTNANKNCVLGKEGGANDVALRGALRWIASDKVELNLSADFANNNDEPQPGLNLFADRASVGLPPVLLNGVAYSPAFQSPDAFTNYSTYSNGTVNYGTHNDLRLWGVAGTIDVELADHLKLKSITSYRSQRGEYDGDGDGTPFPISLTHSIISQKQFTQEVRLNGELGSAVDYTVGGYYFHANGGFNGAIDTPTLKFAFDDVIKSKSESAFVHVVGHLTDRLNISSGVRYTHDTKNYRFGRTGLTPLSTLIVGPINALQDTYRKSRWDYRVSVDYRVSDQLMAYAQFSTGYKGGGVNPRPFFPNQVVTFDPETLTAYEVGFKSDLFDRKVILNVAAFLNEYKNIQIQTTTPYFNVALPVQPLIFLPNYNPPGGSAPAAVYQNAGNGRTYGVEGELTVQPIPPLTLTASGSYLDFKYRSLTASAIGSGLQLNYKTPLTPKWKFAFGAQYEIPLGSAGSITPRVDVAYQSKTSAYAVNNPLDVIDARTRVDARLTYRTEARDWDVSLAVTNVTDKHYIVNKFDTRLINGVIIGVPTRPREWSISIRRHF